ncbi:MAG: hypothetical protein ACRCR9_06565, partial [Chitinophagaceae bacterium]
MSQNLPQIKMGKDIEILKPDVLLELQSDSQAFLLPRIQGGGPGVAIKNPYAGMLVYDSTINKMVYYDSKQWVSIGGMKEHDSSIYTKDGTLIENRTVTMEERNLTFNASSGNFIYNPTGNGKMGIGTVNPISTLSVVGAVRADSAVFTNLPNKEPRDPWDPDTDSLVVVGDNGQLKKMSMDNSALESNIYTKDGAMWGGRILTFSTGAWLSFKPSPSVTFPKPLFDCSIEANFKGPFNVLQFATFHGGITAKTLPNRLHPADSMVIVSDDGLLKKMSMNSNMIMNIYTKDGTLIANRTVTMEERNLTFNASSGNFIYNPTGTGKMGVGTLNPLSKLTVVGAVRADSAVFTSLPNRGPFGSVSDSMVVVGSNGQLKKMFMSSASMINIYTGDGTLTGARTATMNSNNLVFTATTGNLIYNPTGSGKMGVGTL